MSECQPIETAPKDLTNVLLNYLACEPYTDYPKGWFYKTTVGFWRDGQWLNSLTYDQDCEFDVIEPTHWMPLPDPMPNPPTSRCKEMK